MIRPAGRDVLLARSLIPVFEKLPDDIDGNPVRVSGPRLSLRDELIRQARLGESVPCGALMSLESDAQLALKRGFRLTQQGDHVVPDGRRVIPWPTMAARLEEAGLTGTDDESKTPPTQK